MQERLFPTWTPELPAPGDDLASPLLELLFHGAPQAIALADDQGRLLRANPALCRRLRRPEQELTGLLWTVAFGAPGVDPLVWPIQQGPVVDLARSRRDITTLPVALPRTDGAQEPATLRLQALRGDGGAIRRLVLWVEDTVPGDVAQQAQAESGASDRWQIATDSAGIGVYDVHIPSGRVLYSNTYLRILGYDPGSWMSSLEEWRNRIHPEDLERVMASAMDKRDSERVELEYRLRHRDGSWRWVLDRGRVVEWDDSGLPLRAVGTLLDVTERRRAQLELERANERMRLAARADGIGYWEYDMVADRPHWDDEMLRI